MGNNPNKYVTWSLSSLIKYCLALKPKERDKFKEITPEWVFFPEKPRGEEYNYEIHPSQNKETLYDLVNAHDTLVYLTQEQDAAVVNILKKSGVRRVHRRG